MSTIQPMERKFSRVIESWHAARDPHPLLVRGARRTGKTFTIQHTCAKLAGDALVKLDFQTDMAAVERIFSVPSDNSDAIIARLGEYKGIDLSPESALIFFDEVQLHEKALNSLRFFAESPWRVIASGSLLGVTTKQRKLPFPSGVRQVDFHPMDFEEFLWALDEKRMANDIRAHSKTLEPYVLHERALEYYHLYLMIGGMPMPVRRYRDERAMDGVLEELREIDGTYTADMTDSENGISGISAKRIWESLPKQLLRSSTKKFKYADVVRGGRRERLLEPLEWLAAAGIVTINEMTKDAQAPLYPYNIDDGSFFKVYAADTGVMFSKFGISPTAFINPMIAGALSSDFRGALAENYVMQALRANGIATFYWTPENSGTRGEIDFVYQTEHAEVIPIEVKSSRNVSAKSLKAFMNKGLSPYAIRLSEKDFGKAETESACILKSLPLYAAFTIGEGE